MSRRPRGRPRPMMAFSTGHGSCGGVARKRDLAHEWEGWAPKISSRTGALMWKMSVVPRTLAATRGLSCEIAQTGNEPGSRRTLQGQRGIVGRTWHDRELYRAASGYLFAHGGGLPPQRSRTQTSATRIHGLVSQGALSRPDR